MEENIVECKFSKSETTYTTQAPQATQAPHVTQAPQATQAPHATQAPQAPVYNFKELYYKNIEPLYNLKYKKYIDIVINYCWENKLEIINLYILNKMFDGYNKFGCEYIMYIAAESPFNSANEIANLLAENNLDVDLFTKELHRSFIIGIKYYSVGFIYISKKIYLHNTIEVIREYKLPKSKPLVFKFLTYDYNIHLIYVYYLLSNIKFEKFWGDITYYKEKLLNEIDLTYDDSSFNKYYNNIDYKHPIIQYIQKNNSYFMCIGSLACNLISNTNTYLGTYQFLTFKSFDEICKIKKYESRTSQFSIYNNFYLNMLTITDRNTKFYFYNVLSFIPVKIYAKVNELYVADINIILCFLFNDLVYIPNNYHDRIKKNISYILSLDAMASKFDKNDINSYMGMYVNVINYLKEKNYKDSKYFGIYNPMSYKKVNGHYRKIVSQ